MKTEFESRVSFHTVKICGKKCYEASVYWKGALYTTVKYTKELCVAELKHQVKTQ